MKKTMMILSLMGIAVFGIYTANAQNCCSNKKTSYNKSENPTTQTTTIATDVADTLIVDGACGMCKTRIETTAEKIKGITDAQWDQMPHVLTYTYTGAVSKTDVSNALLKVGHDTDYGKAPDKVYDKLPGCCKYRK